MNTVSHRPTPVVTRTHLTSDGDHSCSGLGKTDPSQVSASCHRLAQPTRVDYRRRGRGRGRERCTQRSTTRSRLAREPPPPGPPSGRARAGRLQPDTWLGCRPARAAPVGTGRRPAGPDIATRRRRRQRWLTASADRRSGGGRLGLTGQAGFDKPRHSPKRDLRTRFPAHQMLNKAPDAYKRTSSRS